MKKLSNVLEVSNKTNMPVSESLFRGFQQYLFMGLETYDYIALK